MVKNLPAHAGDAEDEGSITVLRRSPRMGKGNPLWYSCLENHMDRGGWRAIAHGVAKNVDMTEQLSTHVYPLTNVYIF